MAYTAGRIYEAPNGGIAQGAPQGTFACVVSRFNSLITEPLLRGALAAFRQHGLSPAQVDVAHVPGAFEIPQLAQRLGRTGRYRGIVCLGAVIRGQTPHFDFVAKEAASGVAHAALACDIPMALGILTCDSLEQALDRAGGKAGNKGAEAALAVLEMAALFQQVASETA